VKILKIKFSNGCSESYALDDGEEVVLDGERVYSGKEVRDRCQAIQTYLDTSVKEILKLVDEKEELVEDINTKNSELSELGRRIANLEMELENCKKFASDLMSFTKLCQEYSIEDRRKLVKLVNGIEDLASSIYPLPLLPNNA
jgi:predicted nuclease with TOPRIM domain